MEEHQPGTDIFCWRCIRTKACVQELRSATAPGNASHIFRVIQFAYVASIQCDRENIYQSCAYCASRGKPCVVSVQCLVLLRHIDWPYGIVRPTLRGREIEGDSECRMVPVLEQRRIQQVLWGAWTSLFLKYLTYYEDSSDKPSGVENGAASKNMWRAVEDRNFLYRV